jgi:hypothetical protein
MSPLSLGLKKKPIKKQHKADKKSKVLVDFQWTTRHYIPEDRELFTIHVACYWSFLYFSLFAMCFIMFVVWYHEQRKGNSMIGFIDSLYTVL